jgi:hypothetical protein
VGFAKEKPMFTGLKIEFVFGKWGYLSPSFKKMFNFYEVDSKKSLFYLNKYPDKIVKPPLKFKVVSQFVTTE